GTGGALRLRLDAAAEEALAYDLWRLDPEPLLAAVRAPVLVLAARQGDPLADNPRRDALRRARDLLGVRLAVRWVAGGHELPLHRPDQVGSALAEICARSMRDKISATWR
ncbi:MAG TPA: hypothetical protein VJT31_25285, partial [Rugosimonospora sp.]|nr:hypothetical protein [Rugosimonospora sp.]